MAEKSSTDLFKECIRALKSTYPDLKTCPPHQRIAIMFSFDIENTDEKIKSNDVFQYFFQQIDSGKDVDKSLSETILLYLHS